MHANMQCKCSEAIKRKTSPSTTPIPPSSLSIRHQISPSFSQPPNKEDGVRAHRTPRTPTRSKGTRVT
jgi:hypothetical protein